MYNGGRCKTLLGYAHITLQSVDFMSQRFDCHPLDWHRCLQHNTRYRVLMITLTILWSS